MKKTICLLVTSLLVGCSTTMKKEVYDVDKFKLIVNTEKGINQSYQNFTMYQRPNDRVAGFHVEGLKQIYVRYSSEKDKNGNPLPDFKTLGHELWHLIKGKYHN